MTPIARLAEHLRRYYSSHLVRRKARKQQKPRAKKARVVACAVAQLKLPLP